MLTAKQKADLLAFAAGANPQPGINPNLTTVQSYQGCAQNTSVGPTQESVPIDPSKANQDQCGIMPLYIDRSATTLSGAKMLTIGGSVSVVSDAALAREYYNFASSVNFLFDEDSANVIGGNQANYSPIIFLPFLDLLVSGRNMIFGRVDSEENGGTVASLAAFATFKAGKVFKRSLVTQGDWEVISPNIIPVLCDPCLQDDNTHASWIGNMPVSSQDLVGISIPLGFVGNLQFCVYQYENARNLTMCAAS